MIIPKVNLNIDFLNIQGFFFPDVVLLLETLYLDSLFWNRNGSEYLGLKCHLHRSESRWRNSQKVD